MNPCVVNCFRSLYLWVDLQPSFRCNFPSFCCELLSFFVPLGWFTAKLLSRLEEYGLWIAFVLCTFGLIYSGGRGRRGRERVVNCFRSLYLWVDLQLYPQTKIVTKGCELLSFFVPLGWFTAEVGRTLNDWWLWIAFVLCTFGLIYSELLSRLAELRVVNCFRSLYLWVDLQRRCGCGGQEQGCELLSFFVPLGWFTAGRRTSRSGARLWIAFVLCTFGLIYSLGRVARRAPPVVNCFRSLYLWVDLQPAFYSRIVQHGCELLSFFVPLGWFTAERSTLQDENIVVNCFRSLYLWVDLQPYSPII